MTSLSVTNTQGHIYISSFKQRVGIMQYLFQIFQDRGFVTNVMIAWVAGAVLVYLVSVYLLFGLGVIMQQKSVTLKNLMETNTIIELNLQQKQTEFVRNNEDVLQSMEKISDLRYVMPTDTSVSRADMSDRSNE